MINLLGVEDPIGPTLDFGPIDPAPSMPSMPPMSTSMSVQKPMWLMLAYELLATASAVASGYHGYKRNNSIGWGIAWFGLGAIFPIITPTIAFAQGFGKRKS